ncbi:MAG: lipoyl synthase [Planctomycetota bacterium]
MPTVTEKSKKRILQISDCGLAGFREVLQQQYQLRDKRRREEIPDTVLIAEHPPVITLGARQSANKLLVSRNDLAKKRVDVVEIRRGGGTTAHNPGQLLFYPILNLRRLGLGITDYIRELEAIGIDLLEKLGISTQRRRDFPGLWVDDRKIASIGVRVSKFVTYHGMAINIQNDLSIFDYITPCGLEGIKMTSVYKETGKRYSITQVKEKLSKLLIEHFSNHNNPRNLPPWLRRPLPAGETYNHTKNLLNSLGLETICTNANCPNRGPCWARGTATVLILGNICTRNCKFCSVATGKPQPPDPTEPQRLARMAKQMKLKYLVITTVSRDDLNDGGAGHLRNCINKVRQQCAYMKFEILTPDFHRCQARALQILADALPFVFAHNVETVPSLYPVVRPGADYQRSLNLLKIAKQSYYNIQTKSSIMLGLGETDDETEQVLKDLRDADCDRIAIGQYLKPSKNSLDVVEYITPAKFDRWKQKALQLGFSWVMSSPFVRSSYLAEQENILTSTVNI